MSPRPETGRSGIDTSSHVLPSSLVSLIRPLLVPTQITPRRTVDSASDWIAPPMGAPGAPRPRARSGDSLVQCIPPSVVAITNWNPVISSCWFHGAKARGCEIVVRPYSAGSTLGLTLIHCSLGKVIFRIPKPLAYTTLGFKGSGMVVPHSHPDTGFQSSGVTAPKLPRLRVRMAPASCCDPYTQ